MYRRTARKAHRCDAHWVQQRLGWTTSCTGTIEPGDRYYDDRRVGWEILRYHITCGAYGALPNSEEESCEKQN